MPANVKGTFAPAPGANSNAISDVLVITSGATVARLSLAGSTGDSVKTQRSQDNGQSWADQSTHTVPQVNTAVTVATGEQWRLMAVGVPTREIHYGLSLESTAA